MQISIEVSFALLTPCFKKLKKIKKNPDPIEEEKEENSFGFQKESRNPKNPKPENFRDFNLGERIPILQSHFRGIWAPLLNIGNFFWISKGQLGTLES